MEFGLSPLTKHQPHRYAFLDVLLWGKGNALSDSTVSDPGQEQSRGNPPKWSWWVIGILVPAVGIAATVWAASSKSDRPPQPVASASSSSASSGPKPTPTTEDASPSASSETSATPTVDPSTTEASTETVFLNTLDTIGQNDFFASNVTFRGKDFPDSLASDSDCQGSAQYNLGTRWSKFTFTAGMDDNSYEKRGALTISVDDTVLWTGTVALGQPRPMSFSVKDKLRLAISYERYDCPSDGGSWVSLGNATLAR